MRDKGLLDWLLLAKPANGGESGSSQLGERLPRLGFSREFLGPTNLPGAQALGIHEATKIIMISEDEDLVLTTFQVVAPILEGLNND